MHLTHDNKILNISKDRVIKNNKSIILENLLSKYIFDYSKYF